MSALLILSTLHLHSLLLKGSLLQQISVAHVHLRVIPTRCDLLVQASDAIV